MSDSSPDGRPPLVVAMEWVTQVTTVGLEMVVPALAGYWADGRWNTSPWWTIVGAVLGFTVAMRHLLRLANRSQTNRPPGGPRRG